MGMLRIQRDDENYVDGKILIQLTILLA